MQASTGTSLVPHAKEVESLIYHMTMVESEAFVKLCPGSFSRPGAQEVVRVRTDGIELCRLDFTLNCLQVVSRLPLFAAIHTAVTVPYPSLSGSSTFPDALAITSDSGTLTLLRYVLAYGGASRDSSAGDWEVMDSIVLGRSGFRVSGAGHFLAVDSRSRAIMVCAPLKHKLMFPLKACEGTDEGSAGVPGTFKLQSGLDTSRPSVVFDCCAVEVTPEQNALFAVLESELPPAGDAGVAKEQADTEFADKFVSFYEFSSSLNTVTRVMSFRAPQSAHLLIPIPCDSGPGGIVICTDTELIWESLATRTLIAQQGAPPPPVKVDLPRRSDLALSNADPMMVTYALTKLPKKFFLLIQNELGDLYRVEASIVGVQQHFRLGGPKRVDPGNNENPLSVRYFDTIAPVTSMTLFKKGYLYCASEAAPHALFRVTGDGTTSQTAVKRVRMPNQQVPAPAAKGKAVLALPNRYVTLVQRHFNAETRKPELRNLALLQTLPNSAETLGLQASLDAQHRIKFTRLSGRTGQHSGLHTVRAGISTTPVRSIDLQANFDVLIPLAEGASLFPNPGEELASGSKHVTHSKVLFSSSHGTLVVKLGDEIQVDTASGFLTTMQTLAASTIGEGQGYIQVHTRGIAILRAEPYMWLHPHQKSIIAADCNGNQIVAAFDNGGIMSFDLGFTGMQFNVVCSQPTFPNLRLVTISRKIPSEFCAVTPSAANEVLILHTKTLKQVDSLRTPVEISSILVTSLDTTGRLFLFVGLADGRLLRVEIDSITGRRMSTSAYACGSYPVRVVVGDGVSYCMVTSSEVWRCYMVDGAFRISPVLAPQALVTPSTLAAAAQMRGQRFDLLLTICGRTLTVTSVQVEENAGAMYSVSSCPLNTVCGKRMMTHPTRSNVVVALCTEYRGYNPSDVQQLVDKELPTEVSMWERSPNPSGKHVSCIHLFDANQNSLMPPLYLNDGEAAMSMGIGSFVNDFGKEPVLVVGCANRYDHGHGVRPAQWAETSLRTYRFAAPPLSGPDGVLGIQSNAMPRLELVHVTLLSHGDLPSAVHVCTSGGFLLAGFGPDQGLHMFFWGLKHFLWKRRLTDTFQSRIMVIDTCQDTTSSANYLAAGYSSAQANASQTTLILCGLQDQSVMIARHVRQGSNTHFLMNLCIDSLPRFVVASCFLDDRTIVVTDRFGSLVLLRIPVTTRFELPEMMENMSDIELIEACSYRRTQPLVTANAFHVGQVVTSVQAVVRPPIPGVTTQPTTVLVYGTILGKIGAFVPFPCEEDAALGAYLDPILSEFFHSPLERPLRQHRSRMTPKLNVVDGDSLLLLGQSKQVFLTAEAKIAVEERVEKFRNVEATHRKLLDLPARNLISIQELTAKMKALLGLSE